VIVTAVDTLTALVVAVKPAPVAPAATVTLAGTPAAALELESETSSPPVGAALVKLTVPCEVDPPVTLAGARLKELRLAGGGAGVTVTVAVRVTPFQAAVSVTAVEAVTAAVVTGKVVLVAPAAIVTLAGTEATAEFALESVTGAPPDGAALVSVTVAVTVLPPTTLVGESESVERLGALAAACGVKRRVVENGPNTPAEFRARTRHHRRCAGRPPIVAPDTLTIWFARKGAAMVEESSTWIS
jgi:hypothetical protein